MGNRPLPRARFEPPAVRAIVRDRVDRLFDRAWDVPLTIVVGPAGAGKTTAAGHLVHRSGDHGVWYRAHAIDGSERVLAVHLAEAITRATGQATEDSDLATVLAGRDNEGERLLVVIDEFDAVIGTTSERAVDDVLDDLPASTHLLTLSRHRPTVNTSRLRLRRGVELIGPDDLRFRTWEVERLFRHLYDRPLLPDEVAELERRTGGWIAALQLFHLATKRLPAAERRASIRHVGRRSGPDWDFLADNVLNGLPDELQLFLLETAPLELLTTQVCDDLLGSSSSARVLGELERLQLVTASMEGPATYRSHEVLRAHLDAQLVEWEGLDAVRKRYRMAAAVLEAHGHVPEALRANCRGEDWVSASRLLGARGAEVADRPGGWLASLPRKLVYGDPWLLLAEARRQRGDGRLEDAINSYARVEAISLTAVPGTVARRERLLLTTLVDRSSFPSLAWVAVLREVAFGDPMAALARIRATTAPDALAGGVVQLIAGDVAAAMATLRRARDRSDTSPTVAMAAELALVVATFVAGGTDAEAADELDRAAAALDVPFLTRLCHAAYGMVTGDDDVVAGAVNECEHRGDAAGAAIAAVLGALGRVWGPGATRAVGPEVVERCQDARLPTLELWALVARALAARGTPAGAGLAETAVVAARRKALRPLLDLAELARHGAAAMWAPESGIAAPTPRGAAAVDDPDAGQGGAGRPTAPVALRIECLGGFCATSHGEPLALGELRPRARSVLRMLAVNLASGVHRRVLCDELWPDDDEEAATRKLQVAVSSIRRVLDQHGCPGVLVRRGDVYALDAAAGVTCDVGDLERAAADGRAFAAQGAAGHAEPARRRALELYAGELLPEEGAAEWVVRARDVLRALVAETARALGQHLLDAARFREAADVCRSGLAVDRYSDPLWRLLVTSLDADGDLAETARASAQYDEVLAELGITRDGR
jgi:DNA-binding SARP family transcriptional activator